MKPTIWAVAIAVAGTGLGLVNDGAVAEDPGTQTADHVFECGANRVPSGTYLDPRTTSLKKVYYNCLAGTITETGAVEATCTGVSAVNDFVPLYGFCSPVNNVLKLDGSVDPDDYVVHAFVASQGYWDPIVWASHYHSGGTGYIDFCESAPTGPGCPQPQLGYACQREAVTAPYVYLTYCSVKYSRHINCPGNQLSIGAHINGNDPFSGDYEHNEDIRVAGLCF